MSIFCSLFSTKHADAWISGGIGVFGAVIGSVVTILFTYFYNKNIKNKENKEKLSISTFTLYHKINLIYSTSKDLYGDFKIGIDKSTVGGKYFFTVPEIRMSNSNIEISTDELWMAVQIGGDNLLNYLTCLDADFNGALDFLKIYNEKRNLVLDKIIKIKRENGNLETEGILIKFNFSQKELNEFELESNQLDRIVLDIKEKLNDVKLRAWESLVIIMNMKNNPLGKGVTFTVTDPQGKEISFVTQ